MTVWVLASLALAAAPSPQSFLPCRAGSSIEYRLLNGGKDTGTRMRDVVRGAHHERKNECIVDRVTTEPNGKTTKDAWVFDDGGDRISNAGWIHSMTAFRAPMLVAPLAAKKKWRFNRTDYVVLEAGVTKTVVAGTFEGCVVVGTLRAGTSKPLMRSTYAPNVGLIHVEGGGRVREAIKVAVAESTTRSKSAPKSRP